MIITNSLGSNYTAGDRSLALKLLFQPWKLRSGKETALLEQALLVKFRKLHEGSLRNNDVSILLFLKGRQAINEALKILKIGRGDEVIVQAFTCMAVVQPILDLGATPIYVDVSYKKLNPSLAQIKKSVSSRTKAIILQHTLGYINRENDKIVEWCRSRKIFIIQDLAHSLGASGLKRSDLEYSRSDLNTVYVLSFSQDKVVDGISGGALVIPANHVIPAEAGIYLNRFRVKPGMTMWAIIKSLLYPVLTYLIRSTYTFKLGKLIHFCAKNLNLLPSPLDAPSKPARLPNALAAIALNQLKRLDEIITHRRNIALIYDRILNKKFKAITPVDIKNGSCLRYPLWVENRDELENKLTKYGFYLMDHWYDAPVSPEWVNNAEVKYHPGSSPNAENLSKHIFNLPTHINISKGKAEQLAELINDEYK